jgi:hypothetical protein
MDPVVDLKRRQTIENIVVLPKISENGDMEKGLGTQL